jgi:hypothetical protein
MEPRLRRASEEPTNRTHIQSTAANPNALETKSIRSNSDNVTFLRKDTSDTTTGIFFDFPFIRFHFK